MLEGKEAVPIFISAEGVPYRLFIHNCPEKEKIAELIECGFGTVESCPVGENTVVLAAPGYPAGKNEIFSIEYIIACCSRSKKLNITDFRLNKISEYNADFNPMDVLEGILTWSEAEKYRSRSLLAGHSSFLATDNSSGSDDGDADMERSLRLRRQRQYSLTDEKDIVECVVRHDAYNMVKGTALWKMMEERKMCGGRTWQSMKEHFLKKILPAIESFNLTETQLTRFKNLNCNNSRRHGQKQKLMCSIYQESSDKRNRGIGSLSANGDEQRSLCVEHLKVQDDQFSFRNMSFYTEAEDIALLEFVAQHKRYKSAGGVRLWKLMERKKAVPGRSWQSMKERYRKVLLQKLDKYLPSDVATVMLDADLGGTDQWTKKRKAPAPPHILSPQTHTQTIKPNTVMKKTYPDNPAVNYTSLSSTTDISTSPKDSNVFVVTSTPEKKQSTQNHICSPKRKLFSQKKSLLEFTPTSENGRSIQPSESQSAVQVDHRELNSKSDNRGCGRSMRYAAVARVQKRLQHSKDITTHGTGKSAQETSEEEEGIGRNEVRNIPTKDQAMLRKEYQTKITSYNSGKQGEIINNHIGENMPYKGSAVQSKSSRHMLQCYSVIEKLLCGKSQDKVTSKKTSYEQNVQDVSDMESLLKDGNFTQKIEKCMKPQNTDENTYSRHLSQKSIEVCSSSHDESSNEECIAFGGKKDRNLKLKHLIPDRQNTRKLSESAGNEREETREKCQENNIDLICMQLHRDVNDHGDVQGIENNRGKLNIDGDRKNGTDIPLYDIYKMYKQNAGQLSFEEYIKKTLSACERILADHQSEVLDCQGIVNSRSSGNEQESDTGHTQHRSEENAAMSCSSAASRTTNNHIAALPMQQDPVVCNSEAVQHPVEKILCSTHQNGFFTNTELSDKELLASSPSESGQTDEVSGSAHVSCPSSSVSSSMNDDQGIVPENIVANADQLCLEQATCCSSQVSVSPSSLPLEELSHSYKKGFAGHHTATTSKDGDITNLGQPASSEHKNFNSSDWCECCTENTDSSAQKSVDHPGHDLCGSCCSISASPVSTDYSTDVSGHSNACKKLKTNQSRGSEDCSFCARSQNMEPCRQDT